MPNFYKVIYSEEQVRRFYRECMPQLQPAQVYFLSLSARNKYLTDEERKEFDLRRTEMFAKTIVRHSGEDEFVKHIYRLECDTRGYTSRTGLPIPQKCLVCYVNLDASSTVRAMDDFQKIWNEYVREAMSISLENKSNENFMNRVNKIDNNLLTCYQQAHVKGPWTDIDIDLVEKKENREEAIYLSITSFLSQYNFSQIKVISTRSGYHVLIPSKEMRCDPAILARGLEENLALIGDPCKEAVVNSNRMVPCPGTLQANYPVHLL
jgi:hypothetical protein